jgi:hypothetical protein
MFAIICFITVTIIPGTISTTITHMIGPTSTTTTFTEFTFDNTITPRYCFTPLSFTYQLQLGSYSTISLNSVTKTISVSNSPTKGVGTYSFSLIGILFDGN